MLPLLLTLPASAAGMVESRFLPPARPAGPSGFLLGVPARRVPHHKGSAGSVTPFRGRRFPSARGPRRGVLTRIRASAPAIQAACHQARLSRRSSVSVLVTDRAVLRR